MRTDISRFGRGWRSNFDTAIGFASSLVSFDEPANGDRVSVVTREGEEIAFIYSASLAQWRPAYFDHTDLGGSWNAPRTDVDVSLNVVNVGGVQEARVQFKDDVTYVYNFNGALKEIRWPDGYKQTVNGNASVTDSHGRALTFAYDADGLLASMTTPEGKVYRYAYLDLVQQQFPGPVVSHREKLLEKVHYPDATPANPANDPFLTYHYENPNFPFALTGITDERGIRSETYAYDSEGRAVSSSLAGGAEQTTISYDEANNKRTLTNALGKQTVFNFATVKGNRRVTSVEGVESANCAAADTSYVFDSNGFYSQATDAEGRVTKYVHNARGLPVQITEGFGTPEERTTSVTWHSGLNSPAQITVPGLTTSFTYTAGRITQITQEDTTTHSVPYSTNGQTRTWAYGYSTGGLLLSVDGPLAGAGDMVTYTYDTTGFVSTITNEVGLITQVLSKNASGQPLTVRDANNIDTALTYDERGRLKTVTVDPGAVQAVTTVDYDLAGNITRITEPDGSYLNYTYNNARRITLIENNLGQKMQLGYNLAGNVTSRVIKNASNVTVFSRTHHYDELGRLLRNIGAGGEITTFGYDRTDQLKTVTDPRSNVYSYAYDALSRLIRETDEELGQVNYTLDARDGVTGVSDPRSLTTSYVLNGFGEAIREVSPDSGTTVYVRNGLGDVTQMTDGRGVMTNYTYDDAGRMLTKTYPGAAASNITYAWDSIAAGNKGKGRLTSVIDQTGSTAWVYDARGNVSSETRVIAGHSYVTSYAYDPADRLTQVALPSGRIVAYARNAVGQVASVTMKKDAASSVENVATSVTWQPMSELVAGFTFGSGLAFMPTYDFNYRLAALRAANGGTWIVHRTHAYGDGLNLTAIDDAVTPANDMGFSYTATNRLDIATGPWGSLNYDYDDVGNRTEEVKITSGSTTTTVLAYQSTSNRIASETINGAASRSFTYDGSGNMLTGLPVGASYAVTYDKRNRPNELKLNGSTVASYGFNALEQMVRRTRSAPLVPAGTVDYVYDTAGRLIAEADGASGAILREYIWLDAMPLAVVDGTASPVVSFIHVDHLMRPIRMTGAAKNMVWQAVWQPYGALHSTSGSVAQNTRFPGQYFLMEQGLHYNWHRFYDPTTGRYTQPDPLGMPDGPARYAYAMNSPVVEIDPIGLYRQTDPLDDILGPPILHPGGGGGSNWPSIGVGVGIGIGIGTAVTTPPLSEWVWDMCVSAYKKFSVFGGGGNGDDGGDDDGDRCRRVRNECVEHCYPISKSLTYSDATANNRCINQCMYDQNCGGNNYLDGWDNGRLGSPKPWKDSL